MANTKEIVASGQNSGAVHCLTIPLHNDTAVLPNASIAEVVIFKAPAPIDDAPDWFLGFLEWREKRVPLISFEAISGAEAQAPGKNSRIAVLNTLNGNSRIPYVGILSQGIPSLAIVQEKVLQDKESADESRQSVAAFIELGGVDALIPDIDEIEQRLIRLDLL